MYASDVFCKTFNFTAAPGSWAADSDMINGAQLSFLPLDRWPGSSARPRPPRNRARSWWWTGFPSPPRPVPPAGRWCWSWPGLQEHTHGAQRTWPGRSKAEVNFKILINRIKLTRLPRNRQVVSKPWNIAWNLFQTILNCICIIF